MTDLRVVGGDLSPPPHTRRHLLSTGDLTRDDVERLLSRARSFALSQERDNKKLPTLRGRLGVASELPEAAHSALEIVVNGLDRAAIENALRAGIEAACRTGILEISAGNYGGKLGKHHFPLHALFPGAVS